MSSVFQTPPAKNIRKLARHLAGRLINLSPLVDTKIPYLSSPEAEVSPLFEYYCYLIEWRFRQRLNDILRQKVVVARRRLYPLRKGLVDKSFNQEEEAKANEGAEKSKFLRRWTAQGRIIAAQEAAKSRSLQSAKLFQSPPSRTRVEVSVLMCQCLYLKFNKRNLIFSNLLVVLLLSHEI